MFTLDSNVNELDWQIHTKYIVAIGKKNFVNDKYPEWIWFPMGMYIATDISMSNKLNGFQLSLTGKDKMCLLDGSVGGALFAEHDFANEEIKSDDGTTITYQAVLIYDMIREAVHVYAKEPYENILINDLEDVSVELLDYKVDNLNCFLYDVSNYADFSVYSSSMCFFSEDDPSYNDAFANYLNSIYVEGDEGTIHEHNESSGVKRYYRIIKKLTYGDTAGYRATDLTYPGELVVQTGGTIVEMLNKVVEVLGEYEYFYDLQGRFIFRRKQIYHNVVWNGVVPEDQSVGYFSSTEATQTIYDFTNSNIIESYSNKPKLTNIRNDWAVWGAIGKTNNSSHKSWPCHLRYAIDDKPKAYHCLSDGYWYVTEGFNFDDKDNANELAVTELQDLLDEYEEYLKSFWHYPEGSSTKEAFYFDSEIKSNVAALKNHFTSTASSGRTKVVDYRELIYRMALDYSRAAMHIKEFDKVGLNSPVALYNIHTFKCPVKLYHGDGSYYSKDSVIEANSQDYVWYYDLKTNTFKKFLSVDLEICNIGKFDNKGEQIQKGRKDYGQNEYTWVEWVLSKTNLKWAGQENEINNSSRSYVEFERVDSADSSGKYRIDTLGGVDGWQVRGMTFYDWVQHGSGNNVYYLPRFRVTKEKTFEIISKELLAWEARLNNRYAIYFADMLSFWNIYYKVDNDLTSDDVPEAYFAGLTYNSQMLTQFQSSQFQTAQNTYYKEMLRTKSMSITDGERNQRYLMHKEAYLATLLSIEDKMTEFEEDLAATRAKMRNTAYEEYYNSSVVDQVITIVKQYITDQRTNVNVGLTAVETTKNRYKTYADTLKNVVKTMEKEQKTHKQNMVKTAFLAWTDNGHWNPNFIRYHKDSHEISFIAPEDMLFWIDFMDTFSEYGKYKIASIGHRSKAINDTNIKAIFYRTIPNIMWLDPNDASFNASNLSYIRLRLNNGLSNYFKISTQGKGAKDALDEMVYETTNYQETITLSCVPIYWFEPNQRIRVVDNNTGIRGEYIIKSFSYQLKFDGMMSITAYRAADRLI